MSPEGLYGLAIVGSLTTCLAAIGARTLRQFSHHELEEICRRRENRDRFGEILRLRDEVALGVEILVVLASVPLMVGVAHWAMWGHPLSWWRYLAALGLLGLVVAVVHVWIPLAITRVFAEPFLFHTWRLWKRVSALMAPLAWGAHMADMLVHRLAGRIPEQPNGETFEEEIRTIVTEGHREGLLEEDAREMIEGVIELGDADVAKIMTPRTDVHMIHLDIPWQALIDDVIQSGHTRIPVYDKNRDDIIGILYSKDLLPELAKPAEQPQTPLRELIRRPVFVPETKRVDDLLEMFQHTRTHIAVVLDEYGGVSGLVTIEDALEEIVGEIVDEYDEDLVVEIQRLDEQTWEVLGRAHVDDVNAALGVDLPDDGDFDTIAGFVLTELGRVPRVGETTVWQDEVRITVLEVTRRRIERLKIESLEAEQRDIA